MAFSAPNIPPEILATLLSLVYSFCLMLPCGSYIVLESNIGPLSCSIIENSYSFYLSGADGNIEVVVGATNANKVSSFIYYT